MNQIYSYLQTRIDGESRVIIDSHHVKVLNSRYYLTPCALLQTDGFYYDQIISENDFNIPGTGEAMEETVEGV